MRKIQNIEILNSQQDISAHVLIILLYGEIISISMISFAKRQLNAKAEVCLTLPLASYNIVLT